MKLCPTLQSVAEVLYYAWVQTVRRKDGQARMYGVVKRPEDLLR